MINLNQESATLFNQHLKEPLAYRLAPKSFKDYVGQTHIIGEISLLGRLIANEELVSIILWGRPGCGKTALARLISIETKARFIKLNAVMSKVSDIRDAISLAKSEKAMGKRTMGSYRY